MIAETRERTVEVYTSKVVRERRCDACDDWFRLTRPMRLYCSTRCQRIAYQRRRRVREA